MKLIGIYCIRNVNRGKCYVGQSVDIRSRQEFHFSFRGCFAIHHAIRKYGRNAFVFEILELCLEKNLDARECHWICALDCVSPNGYNLREGGSHGRLSDETKSKISKANKGKVPWVKGRKLSPDHRRKISEAQKGRSSPNRGRFFSVEHRRNISISKTGKPRPDSRRQDVWKHAQEIVNMHNTGMSIRAIARHFECNRSTIERILKQS